MDQNDDVLGAERRVGFLGPGLALICWYRHPGEVRGFWSLRCQPFSLSSQLPDNGTFHYGINVAKFFPVW